MKTKEYVEKYNLDKNDKFNHNEFIADLTVDFMTLLEVGKAKENIKGYENAVRAIRMKWESINNKTVGQLPDKLWSYFYATIVAKMREDLFPKTMEARRKRKAEYEEMRKWEEDDLNREARGLFDYLISEYLLKLYKNIVCPSKSFALLELNKEASEEEIKNRYWELAKIHHPDKGGNNSYFADIVEAKTKCIAYAKRRDI